MLQGEAADMDVMWTALSSQAAVADSSLRTEGSPHNMHSVIPEEEDGVPSLVARFRREETRRRERKDGNAFEVNRKTNEKSKVLRPRSNLTTTTVSNPKRKHKKNAGDAIYCSTCTGTKRASSARTTMYKLICSAGAQVRK